MKGIETGKEEVKLSLFADGMNIHQKDPIDSNIECLNLINTFFKVGRYKINI